MRNTFSVSPIIRPENEPSSVAMSLYGSLNNDCIDNTFSEAHGFPRIDAIFQTEALVKVQEDFFILASMQLIS